MKRSTIVTVIAVSLTIAGFFVATQPINPTMAVVSSIFIVAFAAPSYYAVTRLVGLQRGLVLLCLLGLYALAVETSAIKTGFPYGDFIYNDLLGNKLLNTTPWTVAFAYPPILLLAFWMARRVSKSWKIVVPLTALFAMLCDLVLDPAAVSLGFWEWREPGNYYGVPLVNFAGWLLSSFVGAIILAFGLRGKDRPALAYSGLAILWFWTWVNLWLGQIIPLVGGLILCTALLYFLHKHATMR